MMIAVKFGGVSSKNTYVSKTLTICLECSEPSAIRRLMMTNPGTIVARGLDAVKSYYEALLGAMPDLHIEVINRHVAEKTVILEVVISGTHLGPWRGVPPTGRHLRFPLCGVYTFDPGDRIAGERIYYDRAEVLKQLGLMHDPVTNFGRLMTGLTHPLTLTLAFGRKVFRRRSNAAPTNNDGVSNH